jgi:hypothetical protein
MDYAFDVENGVRDLDEIRRLVVEIWAGLAFDNDVRAGLRRDGFAIDKVRLTGPIPFMLAAMADGRIAVTATRRDDAAALLDLWRLYFMRRIRDRNGRGDAA